MNHIRPQKFVLDSTKWYKYGAFVDMYNSIEKAFIEAKVTTMLRDWNGKTKMGSKLNLNQRHFNVK